MLLRLIPLPLSRASPQLARFSPSHFLSLALPPLGSLPCQRSLAPAGPRPFEGEWRKFGCRSLSHCCAIDAAWTRGAAVHRRAAQSHRATCSRLRLTHSSCWRGKESEESKRRQGGGRACSGWKAGHDSQLRWIALCLFSSLSRSFLLRSSFLSTSSPPRSEQLYSALSFFRSHLAHLSRLSPSPLIPLLRQDG